MREITRSMQNDDSVLSLFRRVVVMDRKIMLFSYGLLFFFCLSWNNLLLLQWQAIKRKRANQRRWWVRPVNKLRKSQGFYHNFLQELLKNDHEEFFGLYRMWPEQFKLLVNLLRPYLQKNSIRTPLPTELRVAVTLLYLSQGDTAKLKHAEFRIGKSTVHKIVHETCRAIWIALQPIVLRSPSKEDWKAISDEFMIQWQLPNCLGAIDGRHMRVQAFPNSGSAFYNYKQFFSMILLATCDAVYKFTWVDIGQYGSISDGGVWANTEFASDMAASNVPLPDPTPLPGTNIPFPFYFVGDEAFPLSTYMMRPYPRKELTDDMRIFNYRLSRARRTIENTFGIMTARWRILQKPLCLSITNCEYVIKALVCLHNFIMNGEEHKTMNNRQYCTTDLIDTEENDGSIREGYWRQHIYPHLLEVGRMGANRAGSKPKDMRNYLKEYFVSPTGENQVPWQYQYAFRGAAINHPS